MKKQGAKLKKYYIFLILTAITILWITRLSDVVTAQGQDIAIITSPANNSAVRGITQITGSADHPAFQFYIIEFSPEPFTDQWQGIAYEQGPVARGILGNWDSTTVPDGSYVIRMRVVRLDGNYSEIFIRQLSVSNSKPLPTDTPTPIQETVTPTTTPTNLPPTPTIIIDQPIVDTPTPRPVETSDPLNAQKENSSLVPTVKGVSFSPLRDAFIYGAGLMFSIFLIFGFMAALKIFIKGFANRTKRKN